MTKIGLHMPVWKREELTRSVARYHASLDIEGLELVPVAGCTRREDIDVVQSEGWGWVQVPNEPLTRKHNLGVEAFETLDVDGVVHLNSDDYLSEGYFRWLVELCGDLPVLALRDQTYLLERSGAPQCVHLRHAKPGSGTFMSSDVLERAAWTPWDGTRNRHLDKLLFNTLSMHLRGEEKIGEIKTSPDVQIFGVKRKDAEQMWSIDQLMEFAGQPKLVAPKPYLQRHYSMLLDDPLINSVLQEGSS